MTSDPKAKTGTAPISDTAMSPSLAVNQLRKRRHDAIARDGAAERLQHGRGRLTARERIEQLLDPGTFVETDLFATHRTTTFGMDQKRIPGDGVVTGWGYIDDRLVFLFSHDASVFGGSLGEVFAEKVCKIMDLALQNGAPCIGINDSGGARIQEGVVSLAGYAEIFRRNVAASGVIPQISIVVGPCTGGAVYSPALTDFTIMVRDMGQMFITGPDVVRVTTGEEVTFDQLGGAGIHTAKSGVAHLSCDTEREAFRKCRELLSFLPSNNRHTLSVHGGSVPKAGSSSDGRKLDLADDLRPQLSGLVPNDAHQPYDMHEVLLAVADEGKYFEIMPLFARNIITAFARLHGETVGLVANQPRVLAGALDIDASTKAARFIRFCDAFGIPLITFVDVPGFLPGTDQEHHGIIRHGAKLLYAYCEASVPKLTVITRKAYGGAYDVMCSKHIGADYNAAWPSAEIAVMGPEGAVSVVYKRQLQEAGGAADRTALIEEYRKQFANPYYAAERGYIDDVIEPQATRQALASALAMCRNKEIPLPHRKHGNIPL